MDEELDGMAAYVNAINNPSRDDPTWPLPSFDAKDWAEAFCKIHPGHDEGMMLSWFANALMRGYDEHARRAADAARAVGDEEAVEIMAKAIDQDQTYQSCNTTAELTAHWCRVGVSALRAAGLKVVRG